MSVLLLSQYYRWGNSSSEKLSYLAELTWLVSWEVKPGSQPQGFVLPLRSMIWRKYSVMTIITAVITVLITPLEIWLQAAKVCHEAGLRVTTDTGATERFCWCCLTGVSLASPVQVTPGKSGDPYELLSPSCLSGRRVASRLKVQTLKANMKMDIYMVTSVMTYYVRRAQGWGDSVETLLK